MVLKSGGIMCLDGVQYTDPELRNGNPAEAYWSGSDNVEFAVSNLQTSFNEVNVSDNGSFAGQLSGSKVSDDITCSGSGSGNGSGSISLDTDAQSMLDLAEDLLSNALSGGGDLKEVQGYVYRYYAACGAYIGFKDGVVFTFGGPFGNRLKARGSIGQVTGSLQNYQASITVDSSGGSVDVDLDVDAGDIDTGDVDITGEWDLTISGTVATVVAGVAAPGLEFSVSIQNIAAPDPSDTDEVISALTETLEGVSGIEIQHIAVDNNTDSQFTFAVHFTASQNGATVDMQLLYDYVR